MILSFPPFLAVDSGKQEQNQMLCSTEYKPFTRGHVKYSCFTGTDVFAASFIRLFLLYPVSTIKPFYNTSAIFVLEIFM